MFKTLVLTTTFVLAVSFTAIAQEPTVPTASTVDKPADNRLEVETADLTQPAAKGITPKKEHKGTVPRRANKLSKEKREIIRNLDKEYTRLIDILQVRIDLLKKEHTKKVDEKINELINELNNAGTATVEKK
ncbi:MAG: hypothetical protein LBC74_14650 [Planctomycetaceae bacterium]|jgi:hypothetical protein|nr:hypothetical protein [Planctomycetaceae bacterium]